MAKEEQGISEEEEDDDGDYNDESLRILVRNSVAWRKRELVICKTWKHGNNIPPCIYKTIQSMWTYKFSLSYSHWYRVVAYK